MNTRLFQLYPDPLCAKIRKILEFKGMAYDIVELDYLNRAELLAVSGQIEVPALEIDAGEIAVGSEWIMTRLEALMPEPTVLAPLNRGLHLTLARYFESGLSDAMMRAAVPDLLEFYRRQGDQQLAFFRMVQDARYGAGFCDQAAEAGDLNLQQVRELLSPLDEALNEKAFLIGRLGLADFALYGQLWNLGFTGELKIPQELSNVREFFSRIDRLSASLEP
jgi:glutathione S-transferase